MDLLIKEGATESKLVVDSIDVANGIRMGIDAANSLISVPRNIHVYISRFGRWFEITDPIPFHYVDRMPTSRRDLIDADRLHQFIMLLRHTPGYRVYSVTSEQIAHLSRGIKTAAEGFGMKIDQLLYVVDQFNWSPYLVY